MLLIFKYFYMYSSQKDLLKSIEEIFPKVLDPVELHILHSVSVCGYYL
jgi:hypothetical protein